MADQMAMMTVATIAGAANAVVAAIMTKTAVRTVAKIAEVADAVVMVMVMKTAVMMIDSDSVTKSLFECGTVV